MFEGRLKLSTCACLATRDQRNLSSIAAREKSPPASRSLTRAHGTEGSSAAQNQHRKWQAWEMWGTKWERAMQSNTIYSRPQSLLEVVQSVTVSATVVPLSTQADPDGSRIAATAATGTCCSAFIHSHIPVQSVQFSLHFPVQLPVWTWPCPSGEVRETWKLGDIFKHERIQMNKLYQRKTVTQLHKYAKQSCLYQVLHAAGEGSHIAIPNVLPACAFTLHKIDHGLNDLCTATRV